MEGDLCRSEPFFGNKSFEAGLQGRFESGGCSGIVLEGHEQDYGFYQAR